MTGRPEDRRAYPRVDAAFDLRLNVEVGAAGSRPALGKTVNVSRGGLLAAVDRRVPLGCRCAIQFEGAEAEDRISPMHVSGRVLRLTPRATDFLVAVMFDTPLEALNVVKTAWRKKRLPHMGPRDP